MKKLLALLIVILLLIPIAPQILHKVLVNHANIVMLLSPDYNGGGTGFHVKAPSGKIYIMTNKHVCSAAKQIKFKIEKVKVDKKIVKMKVGIGPLYMAVADGHKVVNKKVISIYEEHDLCLVEPIKDSGLTRLNNPIDFLPVVTAGFGGLDSLSANLGYRNGPHMASICYEGGFFGCTDLRFLKTDAYTFLVRGGHSGSPVLSPHGSLIGVVFAGSGFETLVVPIAYVVDFLKDK